MPILKWFLLWSTNASNMVDWRGAQAVVGCRIARIVGWWTEELNVELAALIVRLFPRG